MTLGVNINGVSYTTVVQSGDLSSSYSFQSALPAEIANLVGNGNTSNLYWDGCDNGKAWSTLQPYGQYDPNIYLDWYWGGRTGRKPELGSTGKFLFQMDV